MSRNSNKANFFLYVHGIIFCCTKKQAKQAKQKRILKPIRRIHGDQSKMLGYVETPEKTLRWWYNTTNTTVDGWTWAWSTHATSTWNNGQHCRLHDLFLLCVSVLANADNALATAVQRVYTIHSRFHVITKKRAQYTYGSLHPIFHLPYRVIWKTTVTKYIPSFLFRLVFYSLLFFIFFSSCTEQQQQKKTGWNSNKRPFRYTETSGNFPKYRSWLPLRTGATTTTGFIFARGLYL